MKKILLLLVRVYQLLFSPWLGTHCRFAPSCSHYACDAINLHGALRGSFIAMKRLLRCHPFAESKFDPVPTVTH